METYKQLLTIIRKGIHLHETFSKIFKPQYILCENKNMKLAASTKSEFQQVEQIFKKHQN